MKKQPESTALPDKGDVVIVKGHGRQRLSHPIGEGGEGRIFLTDCGLACKIYKKERLTEKRYEKLSLMVKKKISIPGVCWPLGLVFTRGKEFAGYAMPAADGKPMQKCMFVKPLLEKNFPHWRRLNLVRLSIKWLETIAALHRCNILVGDVNPLNFLIASDQDIYFVDTDSYQIDDFPCPVGMVNFTAPEIQGRDFSTFLRTLEHEYFAVATLLFMILLPGKSPYSHQGGGNPLDNIKKMHFPYPVGEDSKKKTPEGPWRFIWSHLPYKVKRAFYDCFVHQKRVPPAKWLELMDKYRYALENNYLDPGGESEKLFPGRLKQLSKYSQKRYNKDIEGSSITIAFKCDSCGTTFKLEGETAADMALKAVKLCMACKRSPLDLTAMKPGDETLTCMECSEHFIFSGNEKEFFHKKGFYAPKRCPNCREKKKTQSSDNLKDGNLEFQAQPVVKKRENIILRLYRKLFGSGKRRI
ncbi:MAG: zinc-ribbon domain containing protein [Desulfamplus sp.]|nr:zinc-ribbon domain containing protein [Desulfamplus sp.]